LPAINYTIRARATPSDPQSERTKTKLSASREIVSRRRRTRLSEEKKKITTRSTEPICDTKREKSKTSEAKKWRQKQKRLKRHSREAVIGENALLLSSKLFSVSLEFTVAAFGRRDKRAFSFEIDRSDAKARKAKKKKTFMAFGKATHEWMRNRK
jgi:hypothetical protein